MHVDQEAIYLFDVETTGLSGARDRICEIAALRWLPPSVRAEVPSLEWSTLVNPGIPIPAGARAVHGIGDDDVVDAPSVEQAIATFNRFVPETALIVAHHIAFDRSFVDLGARRQACTLRIARRLWPQAPSHKNAELAAWLGVDISAYRRHRALADVSMTAAIFDRIVARLTELDGVPPSADRIATWCEDAPTVTVLPFGKYRGVALRDVPLDYLCYAQKSWSDVESRLREALSREIDRRAMEEVSAHSL